MTTPPSIQDPRPLMRVPQRSPSPFSFLQRSRSKEPSVERKISSGSRLNRKKQIYFDRGEEPKSNQNAQVVAVESPQLPEYTPQPLLRTFSTEELVPNRIAIISNKIGGKMVSNAAIEIPPRGVSQGLAPSAPTSPDENAYPSPGAESMTHRGRYTYANSPIGTLNGPRRMRRRRDPTPYNVLIVGARGSGKTSFLNFLKTSLALPAKKHPSPRTEEFLDSPSKLGNGNPNFVSHYLESEIDNERVGLTLWDSKGLDKNVVDLQLREMSHFLENKFQDTFNEEMKVVRTPGNRDTLIHCVFFILDPVRLDANIQAAQQRFTTESRSGILGRSPRIVGGLDEDFEIQVFRALQGKSTVIPIISKADTITTAHMAFLKKTVRDSLRKTGLDPLEVLDSDGDEGDDNDEESGDLQTGFDKTDPDDIEEEERPPTRDTADSDTLPREPPTPTIRRNPSHEGKSSSSLSSVLSSESDSLPFSTLSPDPYDQEQCKANTAPGRMFAWGFADPYNPEHCDFVKLKENCFGEWRTELSRASKEIFYEKWRTSRLNHRVTLGIRSRSRNGSASAAKKYAIRTN